MLPLSIILHKQLCPVLSIRSTSYAPFCFISLTVLLRSRLVFFLLLLRCFRCIRFFLCHYRSYQHFARHLHPAHRGMQLTTATPTVGDDGFALWQQRTEIVPTKHIPNPSSSFVSYLSLLFLYTRIGFNPHMSVLFLPNFNAPAFQCRRAA